jgi:hypothetical protein
MSIFQSIFRCSMIGAGKVGALKDVLLTKKQNVVFQDLTLVPRPDPRPLFSSLSNFSTACQAFSAKLGREIPSALRFVSPYS